MKLRLFKDPKSNRNIIYEVVTVVVDSETNVTMATVMDILTKIKTVFNFNNLLLHSQEISNLVSTTSEGDGYLIYETFKIVKPIRITSNGLMLEKSDLILEIPLDYLEPSVYDPAYMDNPLAV